MPRYDTEDYRPPAPVAEVTLRNTASGALVPGVLLLIDTGADITLLPRAAVERLGVQPVVGAEFKLQGFDGNDSTAPLV